MFRKTTSNYPSKEKIWKDILLLKDGSLLLIIDKIKSALSRNPKASFSLMIACILISIGCLLYLPKEKKTDKLAIANLVIPLNSGMEGILSTASTIKDLIHLQSLIEEMIVKDSLNHTDSLFIEDALKKMQNLENRIIKENNTKNQSIK